MDISIHAPRAGGDDTYVVWHCKTLQFQSTPPVRGATGIPRFYDLTDMISIHAPRAGGDHKRHRNRGGRTISIHAPRAGGDGYGLPRLAANIAFQSTPPVRGATVGSAGGCECMIISIHAPRAGGDLTGRPVRPKPNSIFQSTPPVRGATSRKRETPDSLRISIHAPRAGGDHR